MNRCYRCTQGHHCRSCADCCLADRGMENIPRIKSSLSFANGNCVEVARLKGTMFRSVDSSEVERQARCGTDTQQPRPASDDPLLYARGAGRLSRRSTERGVLSPRAALMSRAWEG
jgi:hypothetical protein